MTARGAAAAGVVLGVLLGWVTGGAPSGAHWVDVSTNQALPVSSANFIPVAPLATKACGGPLNSVTTMTITWPAVSARTTDYTLTRTSATLGTVTVTVVADPDSPGSTVTATESGEFAGTWTYRVTANTPPAPWTGVSPASASVSLYCPA